MKVPLQLFINEELAGEVPRVDDEEEVGTIFAQSGEAIRLQAGPILDKNGHIVPDGTSVEFQAVSASGESILSAEPVFTRNGQASRTVQFTRDGEIEIVAFSDLASSEQLEIFVEGAAPAVSTQESDDGSGEGAVSAETPADSPPATPASPPVLGDSQLVRSPNIFTLLVALLTILVMLSLLLILQIRVLPRPYLVQNMLWAMIVGLFAYIMYSAYLLYTQTEMTMQVSLFGTAIVVFLSMLIPLLWLQLRED